MDKLLETIAQNEANDPDFYADPDAPPSPPSGHRPRRGRPVPDRPRDGIFTPNGDTRDERLYNIEQALRINAITVEQARYAMEELDRSYSAVARFVTGRKSYCTICQREDTTHVHYEP